MATPEKPPSAAFGEQLRSCEPDLEVAVGPDETIFRYHGVLLASYSDYIDTTLTADKSTRRFKFPDIEPEVWRKMIRFLEPGGSHAFKVEDYFDLAPLYFKYGFQVGIELVDSVVEALLESKLKRHDYIIPNLLLSRLASLSYKYQFPRSKSIAMEYARKLCRESSLMKEDVLRELLPLVRGNAETLKCMLGTVMGNDQVDEMGVEAMSAITEEDSFVTAYVTRCKQIKFHSELCSMVTAEDLKVTSAGVPEVNGYYEKDMYPRRRTRSKNFAGIIKSSIYVLKHSGGAKVYLESTDPPFGNCWQFRYVEHGEETRERLDDGEAQVGRILYKWKDDAPDGRLASSRSCRPPAPAGGARSLYRGMLLEIVSQLFRL